MCVCVCVQSCLTATPWTVARQAPLSMEFSRQEYWSRLPFPTSGDLPDPGIELVSLASPALAVRYFTTGKLNLYNVSKTKVVGKGHFLLFPKGEIDFILCKS